MKPTQKPQPRSVKACIPTDRQIRKAVDADFEQWFVQRLTPDCGHLTPIDNVKRLFLASLGLTATEKKGAK